MLIGPQNLTAPVSRIRSQIAQAAEAAGRNPAAVTLVAVTKDKAAEYVRAAATLGVTDFGENYVKEALGKMDELAGLPVRWHFIGALQSNKTRPVAERFAWVHSLDRMSVARRLSEQRPFHAPSLNVCIQVALVDEAAKGGVEPPALDELARAVAELPRLKLRGLMCLPPPLPDEDAAWQIQCAGQKLLAAAGYLQYEVSAYAREGARCRHNLNYWLFGDYLGIGAGAHGKLSLSKPAQILRTVKPKQPREYLAQGAVGESTYIAVKDLPFEFMLNALRLNEGFTNDCYQERTGLALQSVGENLSRAKKRGLVVERPDGWQPSELGRRFLNDLQASFLA